MVFGHPARHDDLGGQFLELLKPVNLQNNRLNEHSTLRPVTLRAGRGLIEWHKKDCECGRCVDW